MSPIKTFIVNLGFIGLGATNIMQSNRITTLQNRIEEVSTEVTAVDSYCTEAFKTVSDSAVAREHALQDSLEERIGTLEKYVDDIQFLIGSGKVKVK